MPDNNPVEPAPSPEISIKRVLQSIADQINDGSSLTVETKVQVLNASGAVRVAGEQVAVARTDISIDGDRVVIVPVLLDTGEFRVPEAVYQLHERHVTEAIAYRKEILATLVEFVRGRR
ncbi:MAG: hypothetical protein MUC34_15610 [Anaerolineae bacterium]|jgi:hypothetical protein|nr:hypothetical protein [Anaerolineae bacterium]